MFESVFIPFLNFFKSIEPLILTIGLGATVYTIRQNTETNKIRLFHEMASEFSDLESKIHEGIKDAKQNKSLSQKEEYNVLVTRYLNFLERLALLVNERKMNEKLAKLYFRTVIRQAFEAYKPSIKYNQLHKLLCRWGLCE